ncbi:MAG TPA: hypothetical protein VFW11_18210, partial [Cyclobacteriaceae bacterium]|nr:hypothetical protein [Cyclobacteriaceae bacterium]
MLPILLFIVGTGFSSPRDSLLTEKDSLLVRDMKRFIHVKTGFELDKWFYTASSKTEKPDIILFISP